MSVGKEIIDKGISGPFISYSSSLVMVMVPVRVVVVASVSDGISRRCR